MRAIQTSRLMGVVMTAAALVAAAADALGQQPLGEARQTVAALSEQASYVLTGRITKLHAVSMDIVPVSDRTVVVEVREVIRAPAAVGNLAGQQITLLLREGSTGAENEEATFFAHGWVAGDGLALRELGRVSTRGASALSSADVRSALQDPRTRMLADRIAAANLVISGTVVGVRVLPARPLPTEHDPQWREAQVRVQSVLKGQTTERTVRVLWSASRDVMWVDAPKLVQGRQGIFILHRDDPAYRPSTATLTDAPPYTALHPLDFQPQAELPRVRQILQQ